MLTAIRSGRQATRRTLIRRTAAVTVIAVATTGAGLWPTSAMAATAPAKAAIAAPAPVISRPDAVSAVMAARKQGRRVEVTNNRTETSTTYANPDGTFTMEQSQQPVRVKSDTGWAAVDTTLIAASNGSITAKAVPSALRLSGGGALARAAQQTLVTLGSGSSAVSLGWQGVLPKPTLSGDTATYSDVLPGIDLKITATRTGFETFLVVKSKPAAGSGVSFTLPLTASGLSAKARPDGGLDFTDAKGVTVGTMPAPTMWDATVDANTGLPAHSAPVKLTAKQNDSSLNLTYTADPAFFATATLPVTVDPATSLGRNHFLLASKNEPTRTYFDSNNTARAGTPDGGTNAYRSFFSFDSSSLVGKHVLSATLNTNETHAWTCTATPVELWDTGSFTSASNWSTQPAFNTKLGTKTIAYGGGTSCPAANVAWDVTGEVAGWSNAGAAVGTLALRATSETDSTQWKWFDNNPSISVTYNSYPAAVTGQTVSPSTTSSGTVYTYTATPTLSATGTDPDGGTLTYTFQVLSGSTVVATGTVPNVASGGAASWTPPSLADGAYTWKVQTSDGTDSGPWSAAQAFTVDAATPQSPTASSTGYPAGAWTAQIAGGTSFSFADASSDVAGYVYGLDTNPPSTYTTASTVTVNPGPGLHTLYVQAQNSAGNRSGVTSYTFGVGGSGIAEPADQSGASSTINLKATAPAGATDVKFQYRFGATGAFADVPAADVTNAGTAILSWPQSTTAVPGGVASPELIWAATKSLTGDGPVQIQAVFTTSGGQVTTPVVTVLLQRNGVGADFASTTLGPVSVGMQSGNAALSATDVSIASYRAGLAVSRTFNSLAPATPSMFGPGWTASLPVLGTSAAWSSLTDDGSYAQLVGADGSVDTFNTGATTGGVTAYAAQGPAATSGLVLTKSASGFLLVDTTGTQVAFTVPDSTKPTAYAPSLVTQPGTNKSIGYTYSGGKLQLITAPDPAVADNAATTAACAYPVASATWSAGCRGLVFKYDATTGNVSEIDFVAVDNTAGFQQIPVATYGYDANGRLSAEWDPRISPALKSQYTYDANGRLSSATPAQDPATGNLKPYTFTYDDTAGDVDYGKLLNVTRAHSDGTRAVQSVLYHVPITKAAGGPIDMDASTIATWGQADAPVSAVAEFPADHSPGATPDYTWATIHYYDVNGHETNTGTYSNGWHISTTEFDANGNVVRQLTAANRETALATGSNASPAYVGRVGSDTGTSSATSVTVPVARAVAAGDTVVVSAMLTNTKSNTVTGNVTATDTKGDTFQIVSDVNDGASGDRTLMLASIGGHALTTADTITLTFPSTTEHHLAIDELSGVTGIDQKASATGAAGTNFNSGTTATTSSANELVFGVAGIQGGNTATWTGGFTALPTVLVSADQLATGYKQVTTTGQYAATGTASHAWMAAAATFKAGASTAAIAKQLDTQNIYSADGMELTDSYGPMSSVTVAGYTAPQQARTHTHNVYDESAPNGDVNAFGNPYRLVTTETESASLGSAVPSTVDTDTRTTKNVYAIGADTTGWTLGAPLQSVTDPTGLAITKTNRFNTNAGLYGGEPLQVVSSQPSDTAGTGAGTVKTVYYTAGANSADASCGNQPNWANLMCKTTPAAQPASPGLANLATTTYTYNLYLQPLTKVEDFGSGNTRTTAESYDAADRTVRSSITTTGTRMGNAVPDVVTVYSAAIGAPTDTETVNGSGTVTADLKSGYDDWGQTTSYTDADGITSQYTYDVAGRLLSLNDGKGTMTLAYNGGAEHRGVPTSETDSQAGTFAATYGADGQLSAETYPGGTTGTYAFSATGTATSLSYVNHNWTNALQDTVTPTVHGDWGARSVLNSSQTYAYDAADRLTQAQDTQAGVCTTRGYTYDVDSNRLSLATAAASSSGSCQSTTTGSQSYTYDSADRLISTGYAYDTAGRITTTPSIDAGGAGDLTATYDANDMIASQTQGTNTKSWTLDPQRNRIRTSSDSLTALTTTDHYSNGGDNPSWSIDSAGAWSRNIQGLDGNLVAAAGSTGSATLSLASLHGDIMATSTTSATDVGPTGTITYAEFGAIESGNHSQYGWLGADQRSSDTLAGTMIMGVRVYNTNTGRFDQADSVPGGSANAYEYSWQNPQTRFDLTGLCSWWNVVCHLWQIRQTIATTIISSMVAGTCAAMTAWVAVFEPMCPYVGAVVGGAIGAAIFNCHSKSCATQIAAGAIAGAVSGGISGKWFQRWLETPGSPQWYVICRMSSALYWAVIHAITWLPF